MMNLKGYLGNSVVWASGMIVIGLIGVSGWLIHFRLVTTIYPKGVTMAPVSAILFILLGICLILSVKEKGDTGYTLVKNILLIPAIFMGIWTIFDLITGNPAHIDWEIHPPDTLFWMAPESTISPLSALLFIGLAMGIFLANRSSVLTFWIALIIAVTGAVLILGYLTGVPFLYGGEIKPVSFLSGCGFLLAGSGLMTGIKQFE